MNKPQIYDAALVRWGYDSQVLTVAEECNELAASCIRFINHKANGSKVAEEAADVEIMIEQLRHNGMNDMIANHKSRKLARLSKRVGIAAEPVSSLAPSASNLLAEAAEQLDMAQAFYLDAKTSNRLAAARARMSISMIMQAAQIMIREQQFTERMNTGSKA